MTDENSGGMLDDSAIVRRARAFNLNSPEVREFNKYVRMTSPSRASLDSEAWLVDQGILNKKLLYLDTRFWIDMTEGNDKAHVQLREALRMAVSLGKVLCPCSYPTFMELSKHKDIARRGRGLDLLDELSRKVCLRPTHTVYVKEWLHIASCELGLQSLISAMPRTKAYCHVMEWGNQLSLETGRNPQGRADVLPKAQLVLCLIYSAPSKDMVDFANQSRPVTLNEDADFKEAAARVEVIHANARSSGASLQELFSIEMEELERSRAEDLAQKLRLEGEKGPELVAAVRSKRWLQRCPSLIVKARLCAALTLRGGRTKLGDFFDLEHAASSIPYADCVCLDRSFRHVARDFLKLHGDYGTFITSDAKDALSWVKSVT